MSITQLQKYFLSGRGKRGGRIVLNNFLLLHNKRVEDITLDMKDNMQVVNSKQVNRKFNTII